MFSAKFTSNNINLPCYVYGYTKHLLAVMQGRAPEMTQNEFQSRVQHLNNVMQVCIVNSNLSDHNGVAWQISRNYNDRVMADIAEGVKSWGSLPPNMAPDCYVFAKDHTNASRSEKSEKLDKSDKSEKVVKKDKEVKVLTCKDYNSKPNSGENCSWELEEANAGKRCNRLHCCSTCIKAGSQRCHRAFECSNTQKSQPPFQSQGSG